MKFIVIFICLVAERLSRSLQGYRKFDWFSRLTDRFRARFRGALWDGPLGVLVLVAAVTIPVALISLLLDGVLFGLPDLLFGIVVLFLSLGPKELDSEVQALTDAWETGDEQKARQLAVDLTGEPQTEEQAELVERVTGAILIAANERLIGALFWFMVLDPVGAVLFRFSALLKGYVRGGEEGAFRTYALRLYAILAWLPARLSALGYAVTGSFVDAVHNWRATSVELAGDWLSSSEAILVSAGKGALRIDLEEKIAPEDALDSEFAINRISEVIALIWRTLVLWVAVIAILTLYNWVG